MRNIIAFSRAELFDMVWGTPLLHVARTIGVSDVALAKACRRARIPLPGRGHWAKPEARKSKKPSLPSMKDPEDEMVRFHVLDLSKMPAATKLTLSKGDPISVPEALEDAHPLVARTLRLATKAKEKNGHLELDSMKSLDIRVSPTSLDRALRILDALVKASDTTRLTWTITPEGKTTIRIDGESIKLYLKERLQRQDSRPSPREKREPAAGWTPNYETLFTPRYQWTPTGKLSFVIDEYLPSIRKSWNDTPSHSLESRLRDVLAGLHIAAGMARVRREEREAQQLRFREQERQRTEAARQAEGQRRLRRRLVSTIEDWERACRIRAFCLAVVEKHSGTTEDCQAISEWLEWAKIQADMLDPLHRAPGDVFNLHVAIEEGFTGYSYRRRLVVLTQARSDAIVTDLSGADYPRFDSAIGE